MKPKRCFSDRIVSMLCLVLPGAAWLSGVGPARAAAPVIESEFLRFSLTNHGNGFVLRDKQAGVAWQSPPGPAGWGRASLRGRDWAWQGELRDPKIETQPDRLDLTFHPASDQPAAWVRLRIELLDDRRSLAWSYTTSPGVTAEQMRLPGEGLDITDRDRGYITVPVRLGLLIPSDNGVAFSHRFDTFAYEGCHMEMLGLVKQGAALLVTWHDPYLAVEVRSTLNPPPALQCRQMLTTSLQLRRTAKSFRLTVLGRTNYVGIAKAYQAVARQKGWYVPWSEKLRGHPDRAQYFGAINFKLWSLLTRRMNEESTREQSVRVNWTFDEAAQVAEHLKRDLKLNRVLFIMGGWIHRGYDNQHPDILPAAPECGGNAGLAECARRVHRLGYLLSLHDNYQDMYRDSPSWDPKWLNKNPDGSLTRGGRWAGGRAYITCARMALQLAQRPQNLPAVKKLTDARSYFIDTTFAAGLYECFDPNHPMTRWDDMKWKQALADYAREVFGSFGSECGREWAIPHADFFEGLTGVSGRYYHNAELLRKLGAVPVPLFELVYHECIAMYGKYGYDPAQAAEYVLHHISIGRPLHYHNIPPHLYWKKASSEQAAGTLQVTPSVAGLKPAGPREFEITYAWQVEQPPRNDWRVFVHFTDAAGIRFQNDHDPQPPTSRWRQGRQVIGPFRVQVPAGLEGTFDVRIGLFDPASGARAKLAALDEQNRSYRVGRLTVGKDGIAFAPAAAHATAAHPDPGVFVRADGGWAEGMHPLDRFVKNTYEILSPLNELTAQMPMTEHRFLTADRRVIRTVFGDGSDAVVVTVNKSSESFPCASGLGGEVGLPPYGFLIEGPTFVAFHATSWAGLKYADAPLFTVRSLDGRRLAESKRVRIYHGFGDPHLRWRGQTLEVPRELEWKSSR